MEKTLKVIKKVYLYVLALLPLALQYYPTANKFDLIRYFSPYYIVAAFILAGFALFWFSEKRVAKLNWVILAFIVISSLSFIFADVKSFGFAEIFMLWLVGITMTFLGVKEARDELRKILPFALSAILIANVLGGIATYMSTDHLRFFGLFYNPEIKADAWPNAFANFFLLSFPFFLFWLFKKNKKYTSLKLLLTALVFSGFILTVSRAGYIALAIEIVLLLIFLKPRMKVVFSAMLVFFMGLGFTSIINYGKDIYWDTTNIGQRIAFNEAGGTTSIAERSEFFAGSFKLIGDDLLLGSGPVSFRWVYPQYQKGLLAVSDHPHNVLLKYGVERGLVVMIMFVIFLLIVYSNNGPLNKKAEEYDKIAWAGLLGLLAHSMVDFNLNFFTIYFSFWLVIISLTKLQKLKINYWALALVVMVIAGTVFVRLETVRLRELFDNPEKTKITSYAPAIPGYSILQLYNDNIESKKEIRLAILNKQLEVNPYDPGAWSRLAKERLQSNKTDEAEQIYDRIINDIDPKNTFEYYADYLELLQDQNDTDKIELLRESLDPMLSEYNKLKEANVHFIQSKNEEEYVERIESVLNGQS
ncbi:hypothetical protein GF340_02790 [Candidatus Peregrinibacteria bacterium]|nr:hypothetical protein [Candidatus Peregrinibacteria bacterium]